MAKYAVVKYSNFPKQERKDRIIRTVDCFKKAQVISIELNSKSSDRYYIKKLKML